MVNVRAQSIEAVVRQVLAERGGTKAAGTASPAAAGFPAGTQTAVPVSPAPAAGAAAAPQAPAKPGAAEQMDFWQKANTARPQTQEPQHLSEQLSADLRQMKDSTTARICIGRAGPRLATRALLALRADHAAARDAVMSDVDEALLERLGLFSIQTLCESRGQHLTRPDLGRQFSAEALAEVQAKCKQKPQVQVYLSDGLNALAINENAENFWEALKDGLALRNIDVGTPFFVKYGRVPAMDHLAEALQPEIICVLIGERPGLGGNQSMSAYICYRPTVGMPESRRTVLSNIHKEGTPAVEAGAYAAELLEIILREKRSGVDLKL